MEKVIRDAMYCLCVINGYLDKKIYRNTNENLKEILSNYDFKNKNVLSILSSSDQLFSSYYLGAKNVDTFDTNILSYYFFFLKKWTILKNGKSYIPASNKELLEIIKMHNNTKEENEAAYFWEYVLRNINIPLYYSNLFYIEPTIYSLPYEDNIEYLGKKISNIYPNFYQFDLCESLNINKKYQIIILSNILEYLYSKNNSKYQEIVALNIYNLLDDNGIAISSNMTNCNYRKNQIFENYLEKIEGPILKKSLYNNENPICYVYKKNN